MSLRATELRVGGLARLSTCDWPGELAATVFCQGCAWDCPYCHNPGLRTMQTDNLIPWTSVIDFLSSRHGLLDAVVFSGGEPTLQPALFQAVTEVRQLGFRVGLHTAGMNPAAFARVLPLLDWVGFDVKAPFRDYPQVTGAKHSGDKARKSLEHLLVSGVPYEVRTTVHSSLLDADDLLRLKSQLLILGVENFAIQKFRPQGVRPGRLPPISEALVLIQNYGNGFSRFETR